jgi:Zn ribbon nucleic-acid-binding protein
VKWYAERKSERRVVHVVATCVECGWSEDDYKSAAREARRHVADSGHSVSVEHATHYTLGPKLIGSARAQEAKP